MREYVCVESSQVGGYTFIYNTTHYVYRQTDDDDEEKMMTVGLGWFNLVMGWRMEDDKNQNKIRISRLVSV